MKKEIAKIKIEIATKKAWLNTEEDEFLRKYYEKRIFELEHKLEIYETLYK